jgi:hypothetical protein
MEIKKKCIQLLLCFVSLSVFSTDNEIYIDQSGATANIDLEQLGSGNIIGGLDSVAGTLNAFNLNGGNLTLDINQIGSSNQFLGDIYGDSITGFFEFDGNTFTLDHGTSAMASTLDLDWIINGASNEFDFDINYDLATNYVDIDGDSNTVNFSGSGYQGGYFYLDQTGDSRTFNITQSSTLDNDWLKIISSGDNGTVCVIQNDGGSSTSC